MSHSAVFANNVAVVFAKNVCEEVLKVHFRSNNFGFCRKYQERRIKVGCRRQMISVIERLDSTGSFLKTIK
jgi:DNA polymerase II large subunit